MVMDRPRWRDTFSSLRIRNYRLYVISQVIANTSGGMQRIAVDWLVLELTGNVAAVGLTVALQFSPILIFGAWGGVIADRYSKRMLLLAGQALTVVLVATLAILTLTGAVQVGQVFLAAFLLGLIAAIEGPARSAFVSEMVGTARLRNAISVNASIFHLGGLVGPAISGVLIVLVGSGWSIGVNAVASLVVIAALTAMRVAELRPAPRMPRAKGEIRAALRYATRKPPILWSLVTLAFVSTFCMSLPVLLTAMANDVFQTGASGYGIYSSFAAAGALLGALVSTRRTVLRLRTVVLGAIVSGLFVAAAGFAPVAGVFVATLVGVGFSRLLFATAADSLTQLSANSVIRGRVVSLYIMVLLGGQALGALLMGWVAEEWGARLALVIAGLIPAIAATVIAIVLARSGGLSVRFELTARRMPLRIVRRTLSGPVAP